MTKPPKKLKRFSPFREPGNQPPGQYEPGITNQRFAELLGYIASYWVHVEEVMIRILHDLLGGKPSGDVPPARQIFRGIANNQARARVMKVLLEQSPTNSGKEPFYDDTINEFMSLNDKRNAYIHGLWYTYQEERIFVCERTTDDFYVMGMREVELKELEELIDATHAFVSKVIRHGHLRRLNDPSLPGKLLPPYPPKGS